MASLNDDMRRFAERVNEYNATAFCETFGTGHKTLARLMRTLVVADANNAIGLPVARLVIRHWIGERHNPSTWDEDALLEEYVAECVNWAARYGEGPQVAISYSWPDTSVRASHKSE